VLERSKRKCKKTTEAALSGLGHFYIADYSVMLKAGFEANAEAGLLMVALAIRAKGLNGLSLRSAY